MSPDEAALDAACRAAPDDDLPRLVYADWLDEHGEPDLAAILRTAVGRDLVELAAGKAFGGPPYCCSQHPVRFWWTVLEQHHHRTLPEIANAIRGLMRPLTYQGVVQPLPAGPGGLAYIDGRPVGILNWQIGVDFAAAAAACVSAVETMGAAVGQAAAAMGAAASQTAEAVGAAALAPLVESLCPPRCSRRNRMPAAGRRRFPPPR